MHIMDGFGDFFFLFIRVMCHSPPAVSRPSSLSGRLSHRASLPAIFFYLSPALFNKTIATWAFWFKSNLCAPSNMVQTDSSSWLFSSLPFLLSCPVLRRACRNNSLPLHFVSRNNRRSHFLKHWFCTDLCVSFVCLAEQSIHFKGMIGPCMKREHCTPVYPIHASVWDDIYGV